MPKFNIVLSETVFFRATVEADSREAVMAMDPEDLDAYEFDNSARVFDSVEEES